MADYTPASILDIGKIALLAEGIKRGYSFRVLRPAPVNLIMVSKGPIGFIFQHWPGYITTQRRDNRYNLRDKEYQKRLIAMHGLPVPASLQIVKHPIQLDATRISYPVACKPTIGYGSEDVFAEVLYYHDLVAIVDHITAKGYDCLIESHVVGEHYRILVAWGKYVSCVERRPASVTGDGVRTIDELVRGRNREKFRGEEDNLSTPVSFIRQDAKTMTGLAEQGMASSTVPGCGQKVVLQRPLLASSCADLVDATDNLNRDTVGLCEAFSRALELPLVGFDFITRDIEQSCVEEGAFNEINAVDVGTSVNEHCTIGKGAPVSERIWDGVRFEEIASRSFPEY